MKCRFCGNTLKHEFVNLMSSPPSNSYLTLQQLSEPEVYYPLRVFVCNRCFLVQIDEYKKCEEIFNKEYAYFSSYSRTWLEHSRKYVEMIIAKLKLGGNSHVLEIASNDGYLLQYFKAKNIPCLGIEPTEATAKVSRDKGIDVIEEFFGVRLARKLKQSDLILGNNVLAHVPDINDFVDGLKIALKPEGTITMEFQHLLNLVECTQFDTIYHEHYSYLSFGLVKKIFEHHEMEIYDVEEIPTHGGSLRIYVKHKEDFSKKITGNVTALIDKENRRGMYTLAYYMDFQEKVNKIKNDLLFFLVNNKRQNKRIAAYGAAAKGNALLNYCGIKGDFIDFVVDAAPSKQGKYMPGSHISIVPEERIKVTKPDYIIILPWNIKDEIIEQLSFIRKWGGKFVIPIPEVSVI